jgi:ParB-like chromosome segregation protein Spo0J
MIPQSLSFEFGNGKAAGHHQDLVAHPIAEIFPKMDPNDYADLVEDIRANGLHTPITLYEGKILDGRHRYRACREADAEPLFGHYQGGDPVGHVISLNAKRRHLTPSQKAMIADRLAILRRGQKKSDTAIAVSQAEAAKQLGVSIDSIQRARKVREQGTPELISAVDQGKLTVSRAALVADLAKKEQAKFLQGQTEQWQTADIFEGLPFEGSGAASDHFENIIRSAIVTIQELNKLVADAIWSLRAFDKRKLKSGRGSYLREIRKLPKQLKNVLEGAAAKTDAAPVARSSKKSPGIGVG